MGMGQSSDFKHWEGVLSVIYMCVYYIYTYVKYHMSTNMDQNDSKCLCVFFGVMEWHRTIILYQVRNINCLDPCPT